MKTKKVKIAITVIAVSIAAIVATVVINKKEVTEAVEEKIDTIPQIKIDTTHAILTDTTHTDSIK